MSEYKSDLSATETAILLNDITEEDPEKIGKFYLSTITPLLSKDAPYDEKGHTVDTTNILSDINTSEISPCTESNYIELPLPGGMISASKGTKFIYEFVSGDLNKPRIIQKM